MAKNNLIIKKPNSGKPPQLKFGILGIDLVEWNSNPPFDFDPTKIEDLSYSISALAESNLEKSILTITAHYTLLKDKVEVFSIKVKTEFFVFGLVDFLNTDGKFAEAKIIKHLVSMSINHTRGVLAMQIKDTPVKGFLIPPLDMDKIHMKEIICQP